MQHNSVLKLQEESELHDGKSRNLFINYTPMTKVGNHLSLVAALQTSCHSSMFLGYGESNKSSLWKMPLICLLGKQNVKKMLSYKVDLLLFGNMK